MYFLIVFDLKCALFIFISFVHMMCLRVVQALEMSVWYFVEQQSKYTDLYKDLHGKKGYKLKFKVPAPILKNSSAYELRFPGL